MPDVYVNTQNIIAAQKIGKVVSKNTISHENFVNVASNIPTITNTKEDKTVTVIDADCFTTAASFAQFNFGNKRFMDIPKYGVKNTVDAIKNANARHSVSEKEKPIIIKADEIIAVGKTKM